MLGVTWRCLPQKKGVTETCFYFLQDFVNPQGAMKGACPLLHFFCRHLGKFNYHPPQRRCLLFMIHDVSVWKYVWKWGNRPKPLQTLYHFTWGNTYDLGTQKTACHPREPWLSGGSMAFARSDLHRFTFPMFLSFDQMSSQPKPPNKDYLFWQVSLVGDVFNKVL